MQEENIGLDEMNRVITQFIDEYQGTDIGDRIYCRRINTYDNDYDGIFDIYRDVMDYL